MWLEQKNALKLLLGFRELKPSQIELQQLFDKLLIYCSVEEKRIWSIHQKTYVAGESHLLLQVSAESYLLLLSDEKPQVSNDPKNERRENLIPVLGTQILHLICTFNGSGSFQVLWEVGWLTAAQPHTLGLIARFCRVTLQLRSFLSDWLMHEKVPFHPAWSEAADIISLACAPVWL